MNYSLLLKSQIYYLTNIVFILTIISENTDITSLKLLIREIDCNQLIYKMYDIYKYLVQPRYSYVVSEDNCDHKM